jgi:hypothetical protein
MPRLTIPKTKLKKLARALGGRAAIAEAIGMSRAAVDRYFIGKGMGAATHEALQLLIAEHVDRRPAEPVPLMHEPPTLAERGGHLFALMAKATERGPGTDELLAQLKRMELRQMRIEANQRQMLLAWQLAPAEAGE